MINILCLLLSHITFVHLVYQRVETICYGVCVCLCVHSNRTFKTIEKPWMKSIQTHYSSHSMCLKWKQRLWTRINKWCTMKYRQAAGVIFLMASVNRTSGLSQAKRHTRCAHLNKIHLWCIDTGVYSNEINTNIQSEEKAKAKNRSWLLASNRLN